MENNQNQIEIIMDTREQAGKFLFESYEDVYLIRRKLNTGDYSIKGFEDKITVDRKAHTGEWYIDVGRQEQRFKRQIERMQLFEEAYFICCFPYSDFGIFPKNSSIPSWRWPTLKMSSNFIKKRVHEIREQCPQLQFIFCEDRVAAEAKTYEVLRNYYEKNKNRK